jgi:hypothetical protein
VDREVTTNRLNGAKVFGFAAIGRRNGPDKQFRSIFPLKPPMIAAFAAAVFAVIGAFPNVLLVISVLIVLVVHADPVLLPFLWCWCWQLDVKDASITRLQGEFLL